MKCGVRWSVAICLGANALVETKRVARWSSGEDILSLV